MSIKTGKNGLFWSFLGFLGGFRAFSARGQAIMDNPGRDPVNPTIG
jgi:hypothetical protein